MPIAIVSLGCVLPGAANADALWSNLLAGKSGIVDVAARLDPVVAGDFKRERPVRSDKTYSFLSGRADAGDGGDAARHYTPDEWAALPAVGRFLAAATAQCLVRTAVRAASGRARELRPRFHRRRVGRLRRDAAPRGRRRDGPRRR